MKMRHGFVSNSSSSSFVVRLRDGFADILGDTHKGKPTLTDDQEELVHEYGFLPSPYSLPSQVEAVNGKQLGHVASDNLFYHVDCNQEHVIRWLVEHRIPFSGAIHHGQETMLYDGESSSVVIIPNLGLLAEMYGVEYIEEMDEEDKYIRSENYEDS